MTTNKPIYVYFMRSLITDKVEYVGTTQNPTQRLETHTTRKPSPKTRLGKFYGRTDISMEIVSTHHTLRDAMVEERKWKELNGLEPTEYTRGYYECRKVEAYDYYTNEFVGEFFSLREAGRVLQLNHSNISDNLKGKQKRVKDYYFK